MRISEKSYAKINIFLQILDKREDGFHNLNTLFSKINIFDKIFIESSDIFTISCNDATIPVNDSNIIWKVKDLVEAKYNIEILLNVKIEKKIPAGGGLAGGSSNATTFLQLINRFYNLEMKYSEKVEILSAVGSDTVFFLYDSPMIGSSRGEILKKSPSFPKLKLLVINPGIFISTGQIFNDNNLRLTPKKEVIKMRLLSSEKQLAEIMVNDLERPVFKRFPEIRDLKNEIEKLGAVKALLSGSGSTVFGVFDNDAMLETAYQYFKKNYGSYFVEKTITI